MRNKLIYDLPTRFFHWIFASLFVLAFVIAKTVDDENLIFTYHMFAGLTLGYLVLLRLFWGFFGSRYAKFSSFLFHPPELVGYFKVIFTGDRETKWPSHNPASSWAAAAMYVLAAGLCATGILMTSGDKETFEDVHELLANAFVVVAILHLAGVLLHYLRHKDGIIFWMIDGKKQLQEDQEVLQTSHPLIALFFIFLVLIFSLYLFKNHEIENGKLDFFGLKLTVGEKIGDD